MFVQTRRSNNNLSAASNPVFNNVFDNDSDSIASAKTGDNSSRKGSIVSFMSSITPSAEGSEASLVDPSAGDYKFVETVPSTADLNQDQSHHWVPQTSKSGKLYYVNAELKAFTSSLPFEPMSPQAAANLAASDHPKQFNTPPDITALALIHEQSQTKTDPLDNSKSYVLSRSTDPYTDLVCI